jgi:hypothetical protein
MRINVDECVNYLVYKNKVEAKAVILLRYKQPHLNVIRETLLLL